MHIFGLSLETLLNIIIQCNMYWIIIYIQILLTNLEIHYKNKEVDISYFSKAFQSIKDLTIIILIYKINFV
jgi:hypothetical protein